MGMGIGYIPNGFWNDKIVVAALPSLNQLKTKEGINEHQSNISIQCIFYSFLVSIVSVEYVNRLFSSW